MRRIVLVVVGAVLFFTCGVHARQTEPRGAEPIRQTFFEELGTVDLAGSGWKLWRDAKATWEQDTLVPPPVDLKPLPVHPPTGGWDALSKATATDVNVPGTVEQYFWGADGDKYGTAGHYQGVSFWWRDFTVPPEFKGRRVILHFNACRQRAEVFVNEQLVGYDCVGNTPFEMDATAAIKPDGPNRLCVRITNPSNNDLDCNFNWADYKTIAWGSQRVPSSHGFGGITGSVWMTARDAVYVDSVFVKNKPSPSAANPTDVDVDVAAENSGAAVRGGTLRLKVAERLHPENVLFEQAWGNIDVPAGGATVTRSVSVPAAKLWDTEHPNLYECTATLERANERPQGRSVVFGFRWFAPDGVGTPNAVLRLNGRRVFLKTAISWGYWPDNGLCPTGELAERQVRAAKAFGLNMLSMHRTIADPILLEKADEMGLMLYEEPGGYKADAADALARELSTKKLMRMVKRDRNHPSLVIYGMINELWVRDDTVRPEYLRDIVAAHQLDPSRTIAMVDGQNVHGQVDPRASWVPPYGKERLETGWANEHHAGSPGVYVDDRYSDPDDFYLNDGPAGSIVYWGEEGAISAPPQLDELAADAARNHRMGWDGDDYTRQQQTYAAWLDAHRGRDAFPTVDALCRSLGDIAYYYQGRTIEMARAGDRSDAYAINGWEAQRFDNFSGIVDIARRPKGDVPLLARYLRPLYVAVKVRKKVMDLGGDATCDFFLVNEANLHGDFVLRVTAADAAGNTIFAQAFPVKATGGDRFGELLKRDVTFSVGRNRGYVRVDARLLAVGGGGTVADLPTGHDELFVVDYRSQTLPPGGVLLDNGGKVRRFLEGLHYQALTYDEAKGPVPFLLAGRFDPLNSPQVDDILARVNNDGTSLICLAHAQQWCETLAKKKIVHYDGIMQLGNGWVGGSYFALRSPLLEGLPQGQGMNWEYQILQKDQQPDPRRRGMLLSGDEAAAGCFNSGDPRLATALGVVRYGRGKIILCSLPVLPYLTSDLPEAAVAKRIAVNCMRFEAGSPALPAATQP